jgi:hypothetical protein
VNRDALVIILTAGLLATACGVLGSFLVLRRQALMSDAVGHAVLPGIVLVFLLTGSRAALPTVLGATLVGVACVLGFEALRRTGLVRADAHPRRRRARRAPLAAGHRAGRGAGAAAGGGALAPAAGLDP